MDVHVFDNYWAAEQDVLKLVGYLEQRVSDFDRHIDMTGRWLTWRDLYYNYYLINETNYLFPNYGADGFKRLNINHFREILKHLLSLVTAQRVVPEPISTNTDAKSQAQTIFCKNILTYENKEKRLDKTFEFACETAILLGAGYVSREWDATIGDIYGADPISGQQLHKGDYVVNIYNPLDCIFDFAQSGWDVNNWVILRKYYNRWDLVEKFPLHADAIKAMSIAPETKRHRLGHVINEKNEDLIPLYTFYHRKTSALPMGRTTIFLDSNTCLFDGSLPYKRVPVDRIATDEQMNSPFPYSVSMDLLPIQKVYNALVSAVCTNQAAFGVQNVMIPRECSIALSQLTEGMNAIYYDASVAQGAKPEPLNLLMTKPEIFQFIEYLEKKMAQISGVNDTIQGNPAANLKSGTALAFVASQALTFISPLSRSYNALLEATWTGIVDIIKEFATTPRMLLIAGKSNSYEATQFTNQDIEDIDRVIVEAGNPLTQTLAGRIQIAQDLLQAGLLNKEEYMTVIQTGQIEPLYAYETAELLCIKKSVEDLQMGKPHQALITDNHPLFIREFLTVLASPDVRNGPDTSVKTNTLQAITDHMNLWKQATLTNPAILAIQNVPPFPMPQPPMPPMGPGGPVPPPPQGAMPGKENPNGSKVPQAPNLPGVIKTTPPGSAPHVAPPQAPKLPPGTPAVTQQAAAQLHAAAPAQPPMPS